MKCLACSAEMRLTEVCLDRTMVCGIERHTFRCSACAHTAKRLMLNRSRVPITRARGDPCDPAGENPKAAAKAPRKKIKATARAASLVIGRWQGPICIVIVIARDGDAALRA
jgi:hypothetical protein